MLNRPPRILLSFHARPMCAGLFFQDAFRQAGCQVRLIGPGTPTCYGKPGGGEHTFPAEDYLPPDVEMPKGPEGVHQPHDVMEVLRFVREQGWHPDAVVMIDQYDWNYLAGKADIPFAYVCVENWGALYAQRSVEAQWDAHFHMIAHQHDGVPPPLPTGSEWLPFGFDPQIHRYMPEVTRDKFVIQIGSAYQPRPQVWNHLRHAFDGEPPWNDSQYLLGCAESEHTTFGRLPSYRDMCVAHNRAKVALSCSNVDFSPMRTCEAYGMGNLLASDDVSAIRAVLGPPASEGGFWIAHDRSPEGHEAAVREGVARYDELIDRGIAYCYKYHTYRNRAERILAKLGLQGAFRLAW